MQSLFSPCFANRPSAVLDGTLTCEGYQPCNIACVPADQVGIHNIPEKQDVGVQPVAGYAVDIEQLTRSNPFFRRVLYTEPNGIQLVLMSIPPGEKIGSEVHPDADQLVRIESGHGLARIGNDVMEVSDGALIIIPKQVLHDVTNIGNTPLQIYVTYSKPEHSPGEVQELNPRFPVAPILNFPTYY